MDVLQSLQPFAVISHIHPSCSCDKRFSTERKGNISLPIKDSAAKIHELTQAAAGGQETVVLGGRTGKYPTPPPQP